MRWPEALQPVRMVRVALVAPLESLQEVLLRTAAAGSVEFDLLAEDATVAECMAGAVERGEVAALVGWAPDPARRELAGRLAEVGGAVVPLPHPGGAEPPTLLSARGVRRSLSPLVQMYGTVPYSDVDPTPLAWAAYVLMFGMMFGDAGHGALLLIAAAALYAGRPRSLSRFRRAWPFVAGAGVTATFFGLLYGEFFGPTLPVLWLAPLDQPITLLVAALGAGAILLAGAYAIGTANRWREGGWPLALYDPSGVAGASVFAGAGTVLAGIRFELPLLVAVGGVLAATGLILAFIGFSVGAGGGGTAVIQATVELFDLVVRLGANVVSFARLAAFGLTHAALGAIVWAGTTAMWHRGGAALAAAVLIFVVGNALAFALEALVAGIQALRLEYYELFSRLFRGQGRPFRPWHLPETEES